MISYDTQKALGRRYGVSTENPTAPTPVTTGSSDVGGLSPGDGNFIVGNGSVWVTENGATARASLGLTIGTNVLAYDAGLQNLAGIAMVADRFYYTSADNTHVAGIVTAAGRELINDATAAAQRTTLGVGTGDSPTFAGLTLTADLSVANGGTGASTFTDGGLLVGATAGPIEALAVGASTEILVGSTGANPVWTTATGTGAPVRENTPTLITPVIGAATGTSLSLTADLTFNTDARGILTDTADGTDNQVLKIGGGGTFSATRGAVIQLFGNEHATSPGQLYLAAGQTGNVYMAGNVGIDEATPSKKLDVYNGASGGDILCYDIYTHDGGVTTSDERDKAIVDSKLGLDFINRLNPIQYRWKDTEDKISYAIKQRQVTEVIKEEQAIEEIVLVDEKYVKKATIKIVEVEKPLFKTFDLYDEKGEVIGEHKVPVVEDYKEEHYDERETKYLRTHCGFVAQEVAKVLEDMGLSNKDFAGYIYEEDRDKHGLRYTEFIGPIVAALKELNEKLEKLNT